MFAWNKLTCWLAYKNRFEPESVIMDGVDNEGNCHTKFCQHYIVKLITVKENFGRFTQFKRRETTGYTQQRINRICRSSAKLIFLFSSWTFDIIFQWLQLTSSSMYKELTTQVFSSNTMVTKSQQHFTGRSPAAQNYWTQREPVYFFSTVSKRSVLKRLFSFVFNLLFPVWV